MRDWPPIEEPELLDRLALSDEELFSQVRKVFASIGRREFRPEVFGRALAYPWERPPGSFVLRDDRVELLADLDPDARSSTIEAFTADRHPIVSFGANAAPSALTIKFAHFTEPPDREALVLTGHLHDFDVGAVAAPGMMGYMPATLFDSPGTAVRAAVTWVTPSQATQLAWSEVTYRIGRLEDAVFEMDEVDIEVEGLFAFVSRFGAFCIDGEPVALAAVPARGRRAKAMTQEELLDVMACLLLGAGSRAEDLVRACLNDMAEIYGRASEKVRPGALHLSSAWTPFPGAGP